MKIRAGFVSNSSSSSVIIASDSTTTDIFDATIKVRLSSLVQEKINTIENLNKFMSYHYDFSITEEQDDNNKFEREKYDMLKDYINNGKTIYICNANNEVEGVSNFLYENGLNDLKLKNGILIDMEY